MQKVVGTIEAGGTKMLCAIGTGPHDMRDIVTIPTTTPKKTIDEIIRYFQIHQKHYEIVALGISCFGPIDLHEHSPHYGYITTTPKPSWSNTNFGQKISSSLGVPFVIDTDVNGAALAEGKWGAAKENDTYIYITVGTGVGVGVIVNNMAVHSLVHPEGGHIILPLHHEDPIGGICPYHGNCLEGLACGPSIEHRWKKKAAELPPTHKAWDLEAHYIALGLVSFICTLSAQKIILGGGVMNQSHLFPSIRKKTLSLLKNYVHSDMLTEACIDTYIVPPHLPHCGLLGGLLLASQKWKPTPHSYPLRT